MKRGEVWWATLEERHPLLVLSTADEDIRGILVVAPADRLPDGVVEEVRLGDAEGLPGEHAIRIAFPQGDHAPCNWMVTLPRRDMLERAGVLSAEKLARVDYLLRCAGLEPSSDQ
jgi:mRNA interferase MazF